MKANRKKSIVMAALVSAAILVLSACSGDPLSTREKGTLGGAALGAGTGAIIGAAVGHPGAGAAIGAGIGGVGGFGVGNALQNQESANRQTQAQVSQQQSELQYQRQQIQELKRNQETE